MRLLTKFVTVCNYLTNVLHSANSINLCSFIPNANKLFGDPEFGRASRQPITSSTYSPLKQVERRSPGYDPCTAILRRYVNHFCPVLPQTTWLLHPLPPKTKPTHSRLTSLFLTSLKRHLQRYSLLRVCIPSSLGHKCSDENQISPYLSKCLTKFQGPSPRLLKIYAMYKVSGIPRIF